VAPGEIANHHSSVIDPKAAKYANHPARPAAATKFPLAKNASMRTPFNLGVRRVFARDQILSAPKVALARQGNLRRKTTT